MNAQDYSRELEFAFADLVNRCSKSFSSDDLDTLIPLLNYSAEKGNFEASLILAIYFDPDGCLFQNLEKHQSKKSREISLDFYRRTYQLAQNEKSERGRKVFVFADETLKGLTS